MSQVSPPLIAVGMHEFGLFVAGFDQRLGAVVPGEYSALEVVDTLGATPRQAALNACGQL